MTKTMLVVILALPALVVAGLSGRYAGQEASKPPRPSKPVAPVQSAEQVAVAGPPIPCEECPGGVPRNLTLTYQKISAACPNGVEPFPVGPQPYQWSGLGWGGFGSQPWGSGPVSLSWGEPFVGLGWNNAVVKQCSPFRMEWVLQVHPSITQASGCTGSYRIILSE